MLSKYLKRITKLVIRTTVTDQPISLICNSPFICTEPLGMILYDEIAGYSWSEKNHSDRSNKY